MIKWQIWHVIISMTMYVYVTLRRKTITYLVVSFLHYFDSEREKKEWREKNCTCLWKKLVFAGGELFSTWEVKINKNEIVL